MNTIFSMSSTDILNALDQIGYTPKDLVTTKTSSLFASYALKLAQSVIEQIFEDNQEIEVQNFKYQV